MGGPISRHALASELRLEPDANAWRLILGRWGLGGGVWFLGAITLGGVVCRLPGVVLTLFHFLLVVVSLGCGTLPASDIGDAGLVTAAAASVGLLSGWAMLCWIAAGQLVGGAAAGQIDPISAAKYLDVQLTVFRWLGLGVTAMCLAGFGLAPAVMGHRWLGTSMAVQAIVFLLPAAALIAMTAASECRFMAGVDGQTLRLRESASYVLGQLRGSIAWLAVPVVALMFVADLITRLPMDPAAAKVAMPVASVVLLLLGLPLLTRLIFRSSPIPAGRMDWYRALLHGAGAGRIGISRWDTGGASCNALVAGFIPPWRRLWITDRIEDELPTDQIAMIVLHEVGHLRRRHMPLRMLSLVPAWAIGWAATRAMGELPSAEVVGLAAGLVATLAALRWMSHATEYDADDWACRAAGRIGGDVPGVPTDYRSAAQSLSAALRRVSFGADTSRSSWLHPSIDGRVRRLLDADEWTAERRTDDGTGGISRYFRSLRNRPGRPRSVRSGLLDY